MTSLVRERVTLESAQWSEGKIMKNRRPTHRNFEVLTIHVWAPQSWPIVELGILNYNFIQGSLPRICLGDCGIQYCQSLCWGLSWLQWNLLGFISKNAWSTREFDKGFRTTAFISWEAWVDVIPPEEVTPSKKIGLCLAGCCTTACSLMPNWRGIGLPMKYCRRNHPLCSPLKQQRCWATAAPEGGQNLIQRFQTLSDHLSSQAPWQEQQLLE